MPSKNDLSAIKAAPKNTLSAELPKPTSRPGRKKKAAGEKESETVTLKIRPDELQCLKERAGLVPLGTFVKDYLRNKTDLLSD